MFSKNVADIDVILKRFPKVRPQLPDVYQRIYAKEYVLNREGGAAVEGLAKKLEAWMHKQVIGAGEMPVLEVGAGTLNHLRFENVKTGDAYDVVEPFSDLYKGASEVAKVRAIYASLQDVPKENRYLRIISTAVLEHMEDLPTEVAICGVLLDKEGSLRVAIPSEGGLCWYLAWRCVTGVAFWLRNRLDYGVLMRHEHLNNAAEIVSVLRYFFEDVTVLRFPLPWLHASFYTAVTASKPRIDRCQRLAMHARV